MQATTEKTETYLAKLIAGAPETGVTYRRVSPDEWRANPLVLVSPEAYERMENIRAESPPGDSWYIALEQLVRDEGVKLKYLGGGNTLPSGVLYWIVAGTSKSGDDTFVGLTEGGG